MAFESPRNSKSVVDRAGEVLRKRNSQDHTLSEVAQAYVILHNWRSSHSYLINTFQATLRDKIKKLGVDGLVAQRLKRLPSILNKLGIRQTMRLSTMQDIAGIRAVVESINEVEMIASEYRNSNFAHQRMPEDNYIEKPKTSGYRSLHQIYKYRNYRNKKYDGLFIELQIRTRVQHAWATAVETVDTFLQYSLKSSEGPEEWKNYFSQSSNALAHLEGCPLVPGYFDQDRETAFQKTIAEHKRLKVESHLQSYRLAVDYLTKEHMGNYYLLILDTLENSLTYRAYGRDRLVEANNDYIETERQYVDTGNHQVVLVSAQSLENLRKAYPNYFLDTHEYLELIRRME